MKIQTNINKKNRVHDIIKYPPIERQVYDIFASTKAKMKYRFDSSLIFDINGLSYGVEVKAANARLVSIKEYDPDKPQFYGNYPSFNLPYNVELDSKCEEVLSVISKINELLFRAKKVIKTGPSSEQVELCLRKKLAGDGLDVRYWRSYTEITDSEFAFYIHPEGRAPADGVTMCFESDHSINPWWNGSTTKRKQSYAPLETLEKAAGVCGSGIDAMKKHIQTIEKLKKRIDAFKVDGAIKEALEVHKQLQGLFLEFKDLTKKH